MTDLTYYKRQLPHRLPAGEVIFITFRLARSLPIALLNQLREEMKLLQEKDSHKMKSSPEQRYTRQREYFGKYDRLLDKSGLGPTWLSQPEVAAVVQQSLHYFDRKGFDLICYCIMPNHVHLVVELPSEAPLLIKTLQRLKSYTATQANKLLNRTGESFWHPESYDHVVRDGAELQRIISYVLQNPVKAGMASDWEAWPYSYWRQ